MKRMGPCTCITKAVMVGLNIGSLDGKWVTHRPLSLNRDFLMKLYMNRQILKHNLC